MNFARTNSMRITGGILLEIPSASTAPSANYFHRWLAAKELAGSVEFEVSMSVKGLVIQLSLHESLMEQWVPHCDTLKLADRLNLEQGDRGHLEKEILVAMLASPIPFRFAGLEDLESCIHVRANIAEAARKTFLSFAAYEAERPPEYWLYDEDRGFLVRPHKCLIEALVKATQPPADQPAYSFSCYRATEYVIALALAQEAERVNKKLLRQFETQAQTRAIKSGEFHTVFMIEYGTREKPLPSQYYVPGDRVWFRNPDAASSDATGFEGSWVFYLGCGQFSDFWKRGQAFTLAEKLLEIFHWRHATYRDESGHLWMDEKRVHAGVSDSQSNPHEAEQILQRMGRMQDARGTYADGGCIDPTREYPKSVLPATCGIQLPDVVEVVRDRLPLASLPHRYPHF